MNLETISSIANIVGTATILGGTIFGLVQLSELKKQRRDTIAAELMRTFIDKEFAHAITVLKDLPGGTSAAELRSGGADVEKAATLICTSFETMGLLVFERIAPFKLVVALAGGITVVMWKKLEPWITEVRVEQSQPSWAEWFQWLAQQCQHHKARDIPAYVRHSSWTP